MRNNFKSTIAAIVLLSATSMAFAAKPKNNENGAAAAIKDTRVSLSQAIAAAEQHAGGKAVRGAYEKTKNGWAYNVQVVKAGKVFNVLIDANYGLVIASVADAVDDAKDSKR